MSAELSKKLEAILLQGCKSSVSYHPDDALAQWEEALTGDESELARKFLTWVNVDPGKRGFGWENLQTRFKEFKAKKRKS